MTHDTMPAYGLWSLVIINSVIFILSRIPRLNWAGRTEGRGNIGKTAGSFFHPSGPPEFGYLIQRKVLIRPSKLARGAGRMPFHPVNPG